MPNWCENNLNITGDHESLKKFADTVRSDKEGMPKYDIFGSLYPIPEEPQGTTAGHYTELPNSNWQVLLDTGEITQEWYDRLVSDNANGYAQSQKNLAQFGVKDWYDWCLSHWGTKWGDCDTDLVQNEEDYIEYYFTSAWSPPIDGLAHISTMFPTLSFTITYEEGGMGYFGATKIEDGDIYTSEGNHADIEGYNDLFDNSDDIDYDKVNDMVLDAKDKCLSEVDGKVLVHLAHPDTNILEVFSMMRKSMMRK